MTTRLITVRGSGLFHVRGSDVGPYRLSGLCGASGALLPYAPGVTNCLECTKALKAVK